MTTKNNIPAGYKDSAVGVIPQEWEVRTFQECFHISAGRDLKKDCFSHKQTEYYSYPIFSNSLENKGLYGYTSKPRHKAGCITITGRGMLGVAEYRRTDFDAIVRLLVLCPKCQIDGYVVTEYINYRKPFYFESTGVPQLTAPQIANIAIPVPPMEEQRKIAEILGVWDEAIEKQSRLIEKLELRKRALMQRLLTGRTRLPGFIDNVQYKKLKPFIVEKSERNTNQTYTNVLSVTNNRGFINQAEQFDREVASDNTANYKLVHRGQFAYNPSRVNVGSLDLLQTYDLGILSPMYIVFETRPTMDPKFLFYQLKSSWFVGHIPMYVQGSVRDSLSFDGLENMRFWIPSLPEQKAIAEVLTTADKEIATHRKKLDALRLQKHGLMQQLLTGKTRVKI